LHPKVLAEIAAIEAELSPPFIVAEPNEPSCPLIFCSPHSGRTYPSSLIAETRLDPLTLRRSEDCFVDELIGHVVDAGVPVIAARFPRAFVDVNREPYELDPLLFLDTPAYANTQSLRVAGGLGTIPRIVADGAEIYAARLPAGIAHERIERLYHPFHQALARLIETTRDRFGIAVVVDWHSMPSTPASASPGQNQPAQRPDFVLGDRFGTSCAAQLTRSVSEALGALGYHVHLNRPYAGGYITEYYGRPAQGVHTLQVEINRALYLDEASLERTAGFERLSATVAWLVDHLIAAWPVTLPRPEIPRLAAE
ncbi:MAG: hypothetical protein RL291_1128, partial [Pseudomonadota bacterium]